MPTLLESLPREWLQLHPVLPLPSRQKVEALQAQGPEGRADLERQLKDRYDLICLEKSDPLAYGYEPQCWKDVRALVAQGFEEIAVFGANREGKTDFMAKWVVQELCAKKSEWALFHNTAQTSIHQQQKRVFSKLPPDWRALALRGAKSRDGTYLRYAEATGFSNDNFILPGIGSHAYFFNYLQKPEVWEGPEYDGMWFDEKVTQPILETSRYRRGRDRKLFILVTFTPKWGYTATVANILAGARIVETRRAPLLAADQVHVQGCPRGHMPYIMHGRHAKAAIVFFHNQMNPMGAGREIAQALAGAPKSRVMIRGYGWADKTVSSAFPKFNVKAHALTRARFDEIAAGPGTRYCFTDPRPGKNWFLKWYFVSPVWGPIVYREWPDRQNYEDWALSPAEVDGDDQTGGGRRHDWRPGPAQRLEAGRGFTAYKALILEAEGWRYDAEKKSWDGKRAEKIERRGMDPRFGGSEVPSQDEGSSVIEMMAEPGHKDNLGRVMPPMEWEAAPAGAVHGDGSAIEMIASAMDYDEMEPVTAMNCPHWYVVEDCQQSVLAYQEFTDAGSGKCALKDIVDPDRYFAKSECGYVEPKAKQVRGGGFW